MNFPGGTRFEPLSRRLQRVDELDEVVDLLFRQRFDLARAPPMLSDREDFLQVTYARRACRGPSASIR